MEPTFRFDLGDKVRDRITGMEGIVVSRSEHLFGCERYWVEPQEMKDGKPIDGRWFDQDSLELVTAGVIQRTRVRVVDEPAPALTQDGRAVESTGEHHRPDDEVVRNTKGRCW